MAHVCFYPKRNQKAGLGDVRCLEFSGVLLKSTQSTRPTRPDTFILSAFVLRHHESFSAGFTWLLLGSLCIFAYCGSLVEIQNHLTAKIDFEWKGVNFCLKNRLNLTAKTYLFAPLPTPTKFREKPIRIFRDLAPARRSGGGPDPNESIQHPSGVCVCVCVFHLLKNIVFAFFVFKGNLALLEICSIFPRGLKQMAGVCLCVFLLRQPFWRDFKWKPQGKPK